MFTKLKKVGFLPLLFVLPGCVTYKTFFESTDAPPHPSNIAKMSIAEVEAVALRLERDQKDKSTHLWFQAMVSDSREKLLPLGWRLASKKPTSEMRELVSQRLAKIMAIEGHRRPVLPEVVDAIVANELTDAYPLLRNSFFATGKVLFLSGMIKLAPDLATSDILTMLDMRGPSVRRWEASEELARTLIALKHLASSPPSMIDPLYDRVFAYASSEDPNLRGLTIEVLTPGLKKDPETLALLLGRSPPAVQIAVINQLRIKGDNADILQFFHKLHRISPDEKVRMQLASLLP